MDPVLKYFTETKIDPDHLDHQVSIKIAASKIAFERELEFWALKGYWKNEANYKKLMSC